MYRCSVCRTVSKPRQARLVHAVKQGGAIRREMPVCQTCHLMLEAGVPLHLVERQRKPQEPVPEATPITVPQEAPKPQYQPMNLD